MYIKLVPFGALRQDSLFAVTADEISTGHLTLRDELSPDLVLKELGLEPSSTVMRMQAWEDEPTFVDDVGRGWELSFAHWWDWEKGFLRLIVTSGKLYVVGDNGKTIDRV